MEMAFPVSKNKKALDDQGLFIKRRSQTTA
jgi:hypothetical protein